MLTQAESRILSARNSVPVIITLGVLFCLTQQSCHAGWMGFKNQIGKTVVMQETVYVNNVQRAGKPVTLNDGDTIRDSQICSQGKRKFTIYDQNNHEIYSGYFACPAANENVVYAIKRDSKGKVKVEAIKETVKVSNANNKNSDEKKTLGNRVLESNSVKK